MSIVINRIEEIKKKGFEMRLNDTIEQSPVLDFSKIKVGIKTLDDAILDLGELKKIDPRLADKKTILKAIHNQDL